MAPALDREIASLSREAHNQDATFYRSLSAENVLKICRHYEIRGRDVEVAALKAGIVPERYARNMKTYSPVQQAVLLESSASIVGLGGLGGVVVEILARMGVGTITLIDGDTFEESNLNRQFLCTEQTFHQTKVEAAVGRIRSINPSLEIRAFPVYMNDDNATEFIDRSDVVLDCLGGIENRFILEKASKKAGSPLVSGAVAGLSGHVITIFPEDPGLELIYGRIDDLPRSGVEASLGCLAQVVTLVGTVQCSEAAKILLNQGILLRNKIFVADLMDNVFEVMRLDGKNELGE